MQRYHFPGIIDTDYMYKRGLSGEQFAHPADGHISLRSPRGFYEPAGEPPVAVFATAKTQAT